MIPKIIHRIWLGSALPKRYKNFGNYWKLLNPEWEIMLWTEENMPALQNQQYYDLETVYSGKSNIARYEILREYGGIYVDCDVEPLRPIGNLLDGTEAFACALYRALYCSAVLGGQSNHALFDSLISGVPANYEKQKDSLTTAKTGSFYLTRVVKNQFPNVRILPGDYFFPFNPSEIEEGKIFDQELYFRSVAFHHFDHNRTEVGGAF